MTTATRGKLALAAAGIVTFLFGVRRQSAPLRWVGIGLLAVAFLARFASRGTAAPNRTPDA